MSNIQNRGKENIIKIQSLKIDAIVLYMLKTQKRYLARILYDRKYFKIEGIFFYRCRINGFPLPLFFLFPIFSLLFAKLNLGSGVLIVTSDWNSRWCAQLWKQLSVHQFHGPMYLRWPRPGLHPLSGINAEQIETYPLYN